MVNKMILIGRLGQDPEHKVISNGNNFCKFSVATTDAWQDKEGQWQERTEWHNIIVWGSNGERLAEKLSRGCLVFVEGSKQTRSWEDQQGNKKYTVDIVASKVKLLQSPKNEQDGFEQEPSFDEDEPIPF